MENIKTLAEFGVTKHETVLQNGLRTIFIEKPFSPIYAKIVIGAGSIFNPSDNGLAHMTEHLLAGSKKTSKDDFFGIMESVGGFRNMFTSTALMSVNAEVAEVFQLPAVAKFFSEALGSIYVTPEFLRKEKEIVFSEIQRSLNENPYREAYRKLLRIVAENKSWSYSNLGEAEKMMSLTVEEIESFFYKYCVVENMLLVIAGGCTMPDIEKNFSKIKFLHGTKALVPEGPSVINNQRLFNEMDTSQTKITIGFNGPTPKTRDSYVLAFANVFAHDGMTSRFYRSIRGDKSLAYTLSSSTIMFNKVKYFGTDVGVPSAKIDETIDAVLDCYLKFRSEGMTQKELNDKIETWWFSVKRNMERSSDWVERFGNFYFENEDLDDAFAEFPDIYRFRKSITVEEVRRVLEQYINLESFHLHAIGSNPGKKYF